MEALEAKVARCSQVAKAIADRLGERILGNEDVIDLVITALFAGGHALLEDRSRGPTRPNGSKGCAAPA